MANTPKSRGSGTNPKPRFDRLETVASDDGWYPPDLDENGEPAPDPRTQIILERAKSIISHNDSPDIGFDQSINPYRGCEHGCVYCFARPGHAYLGMSPGLDFETRIIAKPNAAELLERELRKPGYRCRPIGLGTNTDPYQPAENKLRIMRGCLEVMAAFNQPVTIVTKSFLVTRDIDLLAPMAAKGLARVGVSVTSLQRDLARTLEPRAATPGRRLEAIRLLAEARIPVTVMVAPIIPFLTDSEMERILEAAREKGADHAGWTLLRLPYEVKDLFRDWLDEHAPAKANHVLSLIRQSRDGRLNDPEFTSRQRGTGEYALVLAARFALAVKRFGYNRTGSRTLVTSLFQPPPAPGDQLNLI
jgi:DNA repair photolyase